MKGKELHMCYIETLSLGLSSPDEADFCKALSNCPLITNLSFGS